MSSNAAYVLAQKEELLKGGDEEAIKMQHNAGKQTARERVNAIIDEGTFVEIDVFASSKANEFTADVPCEGLIAGFGTIQNRPVYIYSQDYTVMNGSVGGANGEKICKVMKMAAENGVPVIGVLDSAGARVGEGVDALDAFAKIFSMAAQIKGVVPQVSLVLGPCIGASAIAARISDVVLGVEDISQMGAYSSYIYDAIDGKEDVSDICSAKYCAKDSGLIDVVYKDEASCISGLKTLLSYLPSGCCGAPISDCTDDLNRDIPEFKAFINAEYNVKDVIQNIADNNQSYELAAQFSPSMVTSLIKINGRTIGVVANQAKVSESLELFGITKAAKFIEMCDLMDIPLLTLVDNKGIIKDTCNELHGVVTESARLVQAYANAVIPKVTLILNNAVGSGYAVMASKSLGIDMVYSWPGAQISPLDSEASAHIAFSKEIAESENPAQARMEYADKFAKYSANPINAAKSGLIDDIIDSVNTRPILAAAFEMLTFSKG